MSLFFKQSPPTQITGKVFCRDSSELLHPTIQTTVVSVEVLNMNGEKIQFDCKIIENLLDSKEPQLTSDEQRALYVLFRIRMKLSGGIH